MSEEIWVDIEGYENKYQISSIGRVKGLDRYVNSTRNGKPTKQFTKGRILKLQTSEDGYHRILLYDTEGKCKNHSVHRLVSQAFIDNPKNKTCVNHINGIKKDNRIENLEWNTIQENNQHAQENDLVLKADKHPGSIFKNDDIVIIRALYDSGYKQVSIARLYNVNRDVIWRIVHKKQWKSI